MTTMPRFGVTELAPSQAIPETTVNENLRYVSQGAGHFVFIDRDLATPPGSPADGDCYLVATGGTGDWSGHDGDIAFYMGSAWEFIEALEGFTAGVQDENAVIAFVGGSWTALATGDAYTDEQARDVIGTALVEGEGIDIEVDDGGNTITLSVKGATTKSETGTSYTGVLADKNKYIRFTNGSAVAFTIPPNSSVAYPVDTVITVEQAGAGTVTLTPGSGVTLHSRGALLATAGQYAVAQVKKVATDTWTVIGDVA